jgi:F-type H+-transporting ATPase subunit gamma
MTQDIEKTTQRKENIESIEPLLSAMRTISLSNWRSSINRETDLKSFISEIESIYTILKEHGGRKVQPNTTKKKIVYVLGSNRGLCGNFNKNIFNFFNQKEIGNQIGQEVIIVGTQLFKKFNQAKINISLTLDFPEIKEIQNSTFSLCSSIAKELDQTNISVVYNKYFGASKYLTVIRDIYPIEKQSETITNNDSSSFIIDTDKLQLISTIEFILFLTNLQQCFFSSLAAESSARFVNMENAGRNVDNLIDELKIIIQNHRRSKITEETQELAVSSGLLKSNKK